MKRRQTEGGEGKATSRRRLRCDVVLVLGCLAAAAACNAEEGSATGRNAESRSGEVRARLQVSEWPLDALTVTNSVVFEPRAEFDGSVAARNVAGGAKLGFGSEVAIDDEAVLIGNVRGHRLYVGDQATIVGSAAYNSRTGMGTVQGTTTTPLSLPLPTAIPSLPSIAPGTQNVTLNANQQQTLVAGQYRDVTLSSGNGGGLTRLTLSGGTYHLRKLTVGNDARVWCSAPCEIRVKERVYVDARSLIGPAGGAGGMGPGNVQVLIQGTNAAPGPGGMPSAFQMGNDSDLHAYAFVPNGTLRLGHRAEFTGKIVARDAVIGFDNEAEGLQLALITSGPTDQEVRETDVATFSVVAVGEALSYQWQKNGLNIPDATEATYTTPPTVFATDDDARFRVVITNAAGAVTSNEATLTVIPCTDLDLTCDAFDDDCDGDTDEEYAPTCDGSSRTFCTAQGEETEECDDGDPCNGEEICAPESCSPGAIPEPEEGNLLGVRV